ncbi:MAG: penicillin-insensitive murein endopeptidase [Lentisphaeraceae bacterium]|nr:penicillin-insensitive murein endopeptidase [Lentisphaeraceae bacterium]
MLLRFLLMCVLLIFGHQLTAADSIQKKVSKTIEALQKNKKPSISKGTLRNGTLKNSIELATPEGEGYYLGHPTRGSNFGSDRLVFGLMSLCACLKDKLGDNPHHRLRIHDLSSKDGGKIERHINHQMGLDVDIAFYARDLEGKITKSIWTSYDDSGKSVKGKRIFDTARNWEVVEGIIKNKYFGEIRAILVSNGLRKILLEYANKKLKELPSSNSTERRELKSIITKAEDLLRQPQSSPHDNHFHLSLKTLP